MVFVLKKEIVSLSYHVCEQNFRVLRSATIRCNAASTKGTFPHAFCLRKSPFNSFLDFGERATESKSISEQRSRFWYNVYRNIEGSFFQCINLTKWFSLVIILCKSCLDAHTVSSMTRLKSVPSAAVSLYACCWAIYLKFSSMNRQLRAYLHKIS